MNKPVLYDWPYTSKNPRNKKEPSKKKLERDYKFIISNLHIKDVQCLYNELFIKEGKKEIPFQRLKIARDFYIRVEPYISSIRKYHRKHKSSKSKL